jgi:tetratricopeptide (TPR) repeat protein
VTAKQNDMPNLISQNIKSFDENIELLFEELELAIKWERPSILLAIHKSKFGLDKAEQALERKLMKLDQNITQIVVNNERPDVTHTILESPLKDRTIFFVSNIDWGGGHDSKEAYKALNVYRELLIENQIRAVFWLTPGEAVNLPRYAPDFWAFRHRVIEFAAQRTHGKVNLPSGILIWQVQNSIDSFDKPGQRIAAREDILAKLPQTNESLSTRVDLLYNIGYLYWVIGNSSRALASFKTGIELVKNNKLHQIRSNLLNGIAVIHFEMNQFDRAEEYIKDAIKNNPEDAGLLINLSATCCSLGRNQEAMSIGKKAIKMSSSDAKIWNRLGYIYSAMGKFEEAISFFTKAAMLVPQVVDYQLSLIIGYSLIERVDESKRVLDNARRLASNQDSVLLDIYAETLSGNPEKSLELLRKALDTKRLSANDVRRDPNINTLFEPKQIEAVVG